MTKSKPITKSNVIEEKSDQMFKILFESANEGIIVADANGKIVMINPSGEAMFGYNKAELTGQKIEVLIPGPLKSQHIRHRKNYYKDPKPRAMGIGLDLSAVRKDKSEFPVEVSLSHTTIGGTALVVAFVIDITERKKAAEVREETWLLGQVFNESLNEIYMFDSVTLKFLKVNQGALENMGYTISEMQDLTPVDIKPEYDKASFTKLITPLIQGKLQKN